MTATVTRPPIVFTPDPELSFWPTPDDVADDLVYRTLIPGYADGSAAGDCPQIRILEPSAGYGHIVRVARRHLPGAHITAVEPAEARAAVLHYLTDAVDEVVESTVEDYLAAVALRALGGDWRPFDLIYMNPPFTLPDRPEAWAEHVLALYNDPNILAPGGTLAAVLPRIVMTGKSKLVRAVRALLGEHTGRWINGDTLIDRFERGEIESCDKGAFSPSGAQVSTALLWGYKPFDLEEDR